MNEMIEREREGVGEQGEDKTDLLTYISDIAHNVSNGYKHFCVYLFIFLYIYVEQ